MILSAKSTLLKQYCGWAVAIGMISVGLVASQWPDPYLHLIVCDVGQGDATVLTYGFHQIVIDGGPDDAVLQCLGSSMPFWDRTIDAVVVTHADADHSTGLISVLERYHVIEIYSTGYNKETAVFAQLKNAIADAIEAGSKLKKPILGQQISFSLGNRQPFLVTFISPQETHREQVVKKVIKGRENSAKTETTLSDVEAFFSHHLPSGTDYNDQSIVLFAEFYQVSLLCMGDLELKGELALLEAGLVKPIIMLKVGHHGAKTSTSQQFLEVARPEISLVSVGENNRFNHPSPEVMNRLMQFESTILRTDQLGMIEIITDGRYYWMNSKVVVKDQAN